MAKPLEERARSALATDRVSIADLDELTRLVADELGRLAAVHAKASADSVNFALAGVDRDAAAVDAAKAARDIEAWTAAGCELQA